MKLAEIFTQLAYGELSQMKMGENAEGEINENNYPQLVAHVNLGLTALYKRFPLKESEVILPLVEGQLTYVLTVPDIHKIERVHTESGWELGLNDEGDYYGCFTPSANVLRVHTDLVVPGADLPAQLKTDTLLVIYRANHPLLVLEGGYINPETTEVELPYSHLEALLCFIASRVNNPIGMTNEFHAGNSYYAKYEKECSRLEQVNLRVDQGAQHNRLEKNGWV